MSCKSCGSDQHQARRLCKNCYDKWLKHNNPEYKQNQLSNTTKWKRANPEKWKAIVERRRVRESLDPNHKIKKFRSSTKRKYGITDKQLDRLLEQTNCAICGSTEKLVIDHNHKTGTVRARLCKACNFALGFLERKEWANKAHEYLQEHS